ncbi:MAG: TerC family protein [candidate division NC10 bacterium]|nr:TerC family protein [candidate division NC10 bacterium]
MAEYLTLDFLWRFLRIIAIDIVLAGDNAVVIAMAVRSLPQRQRRQGIIWGALAAVAMRVAITVVAVQLLTIPYLSAVGGALVLWIAVKLLVQDPPEEGAVRAAANFWQAIRIIMFADLVMSTDNILAIAGASGGSKELVLFGLALSIPIVMFCSAIIAMMLDRCPWLAYVGAGILGWTGGEMIGHDHAIMAHIGETAHLWKWVFAAAATGLVIAIGKWWARRLQAVAVHEAGKTVAPRD